MISFLVTAFGKHSSLADRVKKGEGVEKSLSNSDEERFAVIEALVGFKQPLAGLIERLMQFPYDFLGKPFELTRQHVLHALKLADSNVISLLEIEQWADALEFRDDIASSGKNEEDADKISNALFQLSTPELSDLKGKDLIRHLISNLQNDS